MLPDISGPTPSVDNPNKKEQRQFKTKQVPHYTQTIHSVRLIPEPWSTRRRTSGNHHIHVNTKQAIIKHHLTVDTVLVIHNPWTTRIGKLHHNACPKCNRAVKEETRKGKTNQDKEKATPIAATDKA